MVARGTRGASVTAVATEPGSPSRRRTIIWLIAGFVVLVIALTIVARLVDDAVGGSEPSGASGSSYATAPTGLAAYAQLLSDEGHPISRQRGDLAKASIDPTATLVLSDFGR